MKPEEKSALLENLGVEDNVIEKDDKEGSLLRDIIFVILSALGVGVSNIASKYALLNGIPETMKFLLWWRCLGYVVVYIPAMSTQGASMWPPFPPLNKDKIIAALMALTIFLAFFCIEASLLYVDLSKQQAITNMETLFVILPSVWWLNEKLSRLELCAIVGTGICIVLATEPVWMFSLPKQELFDTMIGMTIALFGAVFSAILSILKKLISCSWSTTMVTETYFHFILLLGAFFCYGLPAVWPNCSWGVSVVFLAAFSATSGHILSVYTYQTSVSLPACVATYYLAITVFSILGDLILFRDTVSTTWFGYSMTSLAALCIGIFNYSKHRSVSGTSA